MGDCVRRCCSCGSPGGMKSGVEISRPQEPRWIGLDEGSLEKYLCGDDGEVSKEEGW